MDEESDEEDVIDNVDTDADSDAESDMEDTTLRPDHDTTALAATLSKFARDIQHPSRIEQAAMAVSEAAKLLSAMDSDSCANDQFGSIGELCPGADDGSCKGGNNRTTRKWHPLHPEPR